MSKAFSDLKKGLLGVDRLTFGKYEGSFIEDVLSIDPGYIAWVYLNTSNKLDETVKRHLVTNLLELINKPKQKSNPVPKDVRYWQETNHWDDDIPF